MDTKIDIRPEHGHYVAYVNGQVYCTGDTYLEVIRELSKDGVFK